MRTRRTRCAALGTCLLLVFAVSPAAGSLVVNHDFETPSSPFPASCPGLTAQITRSMGWAPGNAGSPDWFHACAGLNPFIGVPSNYFGAEQPADLATGGQAYGGIIMHRDNKAAREYIQAPLKKPLEAGHTYHVDVAVSLAEQSERSLSEIGIYFGLPSYSNVFGSLPLTPQIVSGPVTSDQGWTHITGSFVAAGGETHVIIGSFFSSANTPDTVRSAKDPSGNVVSNGAYYYIDDVIVQEEPICSSPPLFWDAMDSGVYGNGGPWDMLAHADQNGANIYGGGHIFGVPAGTSNGIVRWDGSEWYPLGTGIVLAIVYALESWAGDLYIGGDFDYSGGPPVGVAKWDGAAFSSIGDTGGTLTNEVRALEVHDDAWGAGLFVGGSFETAGGVTADNIALWDGAQWYAVGTGITDSGGYASVSGMVSFDDGSGPALYVYGYFDTAGGVPVNNVARWQYGSWSAVGSGIASPTYGELVVFDDGSGNGEQLHALAADGVYKWNGTSWSSVGAANGEVYDATVFDDGYGPDLYVGGTFTSIGGTPASYVASWDGTSWSAVDGGMDGQVKSLTSTDSGLYAGGYFHQAGSVTMVSFVAQLCRAPVVDDLGAGKFCVDGSSTGVGWSWQVGSTTGDVVPPVNGASAMEIAAAFVQSLVNAGRTAAVDAVDGRCFSVIMSPIETLSVGPYLQTPNCLVSGAPLGCTFNPTILDFAQMEPPHRAGSIVPNLPVLAPLGVGALALITLATGALWLRGRTARAVERSGRPRP